MASLAAPSLVPVRVLIASQVEALEDHVREAFKASPLNATRCLDIRHFDPSRLEGASGAEVVLGDPGVLAPFIDKGFGQLKWLQSTWAGVNVLMDKTTRRDYKLTKIGGVFGPLMAEYVLSYILQQERGLLAMAAQQQAQLWDDRPFKRLRKVSSLTLAVLGAGDIGQAIAERARNFGMHTVALKKGGLTVPHFDETFAGIADVLSRSHYVVNVLPSTPETRGLLSGDCLQHCKGAVFINVGRGDVINEESILLALEKRWLTKAVLDVFSSEPLPASSKLWKHPDVIITPHVSAVSFASDVASIFVDNLERHTHGNELDLVVDWAKGY